MESLIYFKAVFYILVFLVYETVGWTEQKSLNKLLHRVDYSTDTEAALQLQEVHTLKQCIVMCVGRRVVPECVKVVFTANNATCHFYTNQYHNFITHSITYIAYQIKVCPTPFVYDQVSSKCLYLLKEENDWETSRTNCNALVPGFSQPVIIRNAMELERTNLYRSSSVSFYWTSGKRLNNDNLLPFVWQPFPGEVFPFTTENLWGANQPNDPQENCVLVFLTNDFHDATCDYNLPVICEIEPFLNN